MAIQPLLLEASRLLLLSQSSLGALLGSSERTVQRWYANQSSPMPEQLQALARAVFPVDERLAADLAAAGHSTLDALGLAPAAARVISTSPENVVDSVVCAAAEAMGAMPPTVRLGLIAAVTRARKIGLTLEMMDAALHANEDPRKPEGGKATSKKQDKTKT